MQETLSQRIKILYESEKMDQQKFAKFIGVSKSTINHIVKKGTTPNFRTVEAIIDRFPGLNLYWLLKGEGEMWLNLDEDIEAKEPGLRYNRDSKLYNYNEMVSKVEENSKELERVKREHERIKKLYNDFLKGKKSKQNSQ